MGGLTQYPHVCRVATTQSSLATSSAIETAVQQETTYFKEGDGGYLVRVPMRPDSTRDSVFSAVDDSLSNFFLRPALLGSYTWTPLQGAPFTAIIDPWTAFFENSRVVNRVNNYNLMSARLHIRFQINGNGFYYGRLMADYAPLATEDDTSMYSTLIPQNAIQASQRLKVFLDPSCCASHDMVLPFVYYKDAIGVVDAEWSSLGRVYIRELNGLKHANASTQPINIRVWIWAEDVKLAVPTTQSVVTLVPQAGEDEYGATPISHTATATARAARALTRLPVIGPYARATEIAARGVASVAGLFGMSRPAVLDPLTGMRPTFVDNLAVTDVAESVAKLTVDSKQELTIDPAVVGVDIGEELNIAAIAARESYLTTFTWTTATAVDTLLWNTRVTPCLNAYSSNTYYLPACYFATLPFAYWRGRMRFRFQVVASAHHKGRLLIRWDPKKVTGVETNVIYTRSVDISEEKDFAIEIDWGQPLHYCTVLDVSSTTRYNTTALANASVDANGVLDVRVLTDLATPNSVANNDIAINVYVSMLDGEFAYPRPIPSTLTNTYSYTPQAGEDVSEHIGHSDMDAGCGEVQTETCVGPPSGSDNDALVYFGERVVSFRALLRRYNRHSEYLVVNGNASNPALLSFTLPDFPQHYGYNSTTMHSTTTGGFHVDYVRPTLLNYLAPAFVAMRGGLRSKYVLGSSSIVPILAMSVERGAASLAIPTSSTLLPTTSQSNFVRTTRAARSSLGYGAAVTPPLNQPSLEVELPYYKNIRFDHPRVVNVANTSMANPFSGRYHTVELLLGPSTGATTMDRYVGVAEDFSLTWFQGCPPLAKLTQPA